MHPEFLALLNSENMHRAGHLKRSRRIRQMNSPLIEVLAAEVLDYIGPLLKPGMTVVEPTCQFIEPRAASSW